MFARIVGESLRRNPGRKALTGVALALGMTVATATLTMALDVGDRLSEEFRSFGANLLVTPKADTLPLEIGGVDYRPVNEGAYLAEDKLPRLKQIFWRHNIVGFTPFLDVPVALRRAGETLNLALATAEGTWEQHAVDVPGESPFVTGIERTNPWWRVDGRWFADNARECVVGAALAASAGIHTGDRLTLAAGKNSVDVEVTGIATTGGPEEKGLLVPLAIAQTLADRPGEFRRLLVSALAKPEDELGRRDPSQMTPEEYERWSCSPYISTISRQIERALPGSEARAIRQVAEGEGRILGHVSALLWLVTLAALAAAALAVGAAGATTVLERREEVGLMKAIGASSALVSMFFLAEQVLLAVAGGAAGYLAGAGLARVLGRSIFGQPSTERLILLPVALAIAVGVAIAGSLIPLRQAARFEPAPILRGE